MQINKQDTNLQTNRRAALTDTGQPNKQASQADIRMYKQKQRQTETQTITHTHTYSHTHTPTD